MTIGVREIGSGKEGAYNKLSQWNIKNNYWSRFFFLNLKFAVDKWGYDPLTPVGMPLMIIV